MNAAELLARYCDGVLKRSNTAPPPSSSNTATITASAGLRGSSSSSSSIGKNLAVVDGLSSSNNLLNDSSDTESMTEDVDSKLHKAVSYGGFYFSYMGYSPSHFPINRSLSSNTLTIKIYSKNSIQNSSLNGSSSNIHPLSLHHHHHRQQRFGILNYP